MFSIVNVNKNMDINGKLFHKLNDEQKKFVNNTLIDIPKNNRYFFFFNK